MLPKFSAIYDEISLNLVYSFDLCVLPSWGNQKTQCKQTFNIKWKSNKSLNYKLYCEKSMGFPLKMASKGRVSASVDWSIQNLFFPDPSKSSFILFEI